MRTSIVLFTLIALLLQTGLVYPGQKKQSEADLEKKSPPAQTREIRDPNAILRMLLKGNERFIRSACLYSNQDAKRRAETARDGEKPMVTILSCSDSRVPLELIFDQGIGDIFAIRTAGNIAGTSEIGSIEYGVAHLHTPLLIVLGHTRCGAVAAAVKNSEMHGSIPDLINRIQPAVDKMRKEQRAATEEDLILNSIKANIFKSIEDIFTASREVRTLVKTGKLKVIGALYDIESGEVKDLGVHYRQEKLIRGGGKK